MGGYAGGKTITSTRIMKLLSPEQKELLKKALPPEAIKPHPTKSYLSSIKAIYVVERLNDVFGIGGWRVNNAFVEKVDKWIVVKSTFEAPEYGIVIPDIFGGNDNADLGDAYKGACTDALTKIGSYLGIGMDVYKGLGDKQEKTAKQVTNTYNRNNLENNGLPMVTNAQFKKICDRLREGEKAVYFKAIAEFSFEKTQQDTIKSLYEKIK